MPLNVGIHVTVVPDGVATDGSVYRLSLALAPKVDPAPNETQVDLLEWPTAVARLAKRLRIAVASLVDPNAASPLGSARYLRCLQHSDVDDLSADEASRLWKRIFDNGHGGDAGLEDLVKNLRLESQPPPNPPANAAVLREAVGTFHAAGLAGLMDALYSGHAAAALSDRLSPKETAALTAPGDARPHLAFHAGHPHTAWWNRVHQDWLEVEPRTDDPIARLAAAGPQALTRPSYLDLVDREMTREARRRSGVVEPQALTGPPPSAADRAGALSAAATYFSEHADSPQFWRSGVAKPTSRAFTARAGLTTSSLQARTADLVKRELAAFHTLRGVNKRAVTTTDAARDDAERRAAPRRKLTGIMSFPTLAKYLRLVLDVEVPAADFANVVSAATPRAFGAIAADFVLAEGERCRDWEAVAPRALHWTYFTYRAATREAAAYFGPCSKAHHAGTKAGTELLIEDGVINLRSHIADAKGEPTTAPRFALTTVDVSQTVLALMRRAEDINHALRNGVRPSELSTKLPDSHTRGIALTDAQPPPLPTKKPGQNEPTTKISYAEDLLLGYRVDTAVVDEADWRQRCRWRSLVGRDIRYHKEDVPDRFWNDRAVARVRSREDGHVRYARGRTEYLEADGTKGVLAEFQTLFTWTGESLAVPSLHHDVRVNRDNPDPRTVIPCPERDLAIGLEYDTPEPPVNAEEDRRPAPLREGHTYLFGVRGFFVNGCGVTLNDAHPLYSRSDKPLSLGDGTAPYLFQRRTELQAPDVCLLRNDPIVTAPRPEALHGDTIDTLVVRREQRTPARRVLVPGRTSFDLSEQAGVFDENDREDQPGGAFAGSLILRMNPATGALPIARDGDVVVEDPARTGGGSTKPIQSRGSVAVFGGSVPQGRRVPYYPDPLGRFLCARFLVKDVPAPDFGDPATPVAFWAGEDPSAAEPILLELIAGEPGEAKGKAGIFQSPQAKTPVRSGESANLTTLQVILEPGETVDVELWSMDVPQRMRDRHWTLASALRSLRSSDATTAAWKSLLSGPTSALDANIERVITAAPLAHLQNVRRVSLVHAIEKPLTPQVVRGLHAVVVRVRAAEEGDGGSGVPQQVRSWRDYVAMQGTAAASTWLSEPQGSTAFFVGEIDCHRPSTGQIRCEAKWLEYGSHSTRRDPEHPGQWIDAPTMRADRLFVVDRIDTDAASRSQPVSLLRVDAPSAGDVVPGNLRSLAYAFPDGKARRLHVTTVATSRYTPYYEADSQRIDRHVTSVALGEDVWVPATFRPHAPEIDRVIPVFHWHEDRSHDGRKVTWSREAFIRIYLKRSTWHSTGEGEQLAVLFGPSKDAKGTPLQLCGFEDAVDKFAPFLARWGNDPIHSSGVMNPAANPMLDPDRFRPRDKTWYWGYTGTGPQGRELLLPLGPDPVVTKVQPPCTEGTLPKASKLTIEGENFADGDGLTLFVNGAAPRVLRRVDVNKVEVETTAGAPCPLNVVAKNPTQKVTVLVYEPQFDNYEGEFYCDIGVRHGESYFPFVQLGLARYQPHCAPDLELSAPATAWAQIPPRREGTVTIDDKRHVTVDIYGVGFHASGEGGRPIVDTPRLFVRLMRAAHQDRVPRADDRLGWLPVVDDGGRTIRQEAIKISERTRTEQVGSQGEPVKEMWWTVDFPLPAIRAGVRYGALVEEFELMPADPEDCSTPACGPDAPHRMALRGPLFSHIIYIGE